MHPVSTVVMPAHNAEATIRESVASALAQTLDNLELIVVDDGSHVPVAEVLADVRDRRLRILRHEHNRGVSAARNTALAAARAPLVSPLDADDLWEPTYLESVVPLFDDPAVGLAYTNARILRDSEASHAYLPHRSHIDVWITDPEQHPIDRFPEICEWCPICAPTVTARTRAVRAARGYAQWLPGGSDWHLYLKLAKAGWRFAYLDENLAHYRWPAPERGMSYDLGRRERMDLRLWLRFNLRHPGTPGAARALARSARRFTARRAPVLKRAYVAMRGTIAQPGGSRSV